MIRETPVARFLLRVSWTLRLPRLVDRLSGRRLAILMYHGIPARSPQGPVRNLFGYNVPVARFAEHVEYLARSCRLVSLDDVLAGDLSRRRTNVLLTFDDGYRNNFSQAFPVLERHEAPAVFALPSAFVAEGEPLWNDRLEAAVDRARAKSVELDWGGDSGRFDLGRPADRAELLRWLMRHAVAAEPARRDELIDEAWHRLDVPGTPRSLLEDPDYRPLAVDDIESMVASGLAEFACHGVNHFMMAALERSEQRRELAASKAAVETLTGRPCRAFCVPGGSYNETLLDEAREVGLSVVMTSDWGWADPGGRTLRRCGIFAAYDRVRLADEVHGPVVRSLVALRRRLRGS